MRSSEAEELDGVLGGVAGGGGASGVGGAASVAVFMGCRGCTSRVEERIKKACTGTFDGTRITVKSKKFRVDFVFLREFQIRNRKKMIFCFCGSSKYGIVKNDFLFLREFQIRNRKK